MNRNKKVKKQIYNKQKIKIRQKIIKQNLNLTHMKEQETIKFGVVII